MKLSQVCTLERPPLVLKARTAADLMTPNPVSLREKATIAEAAAFLTERGISAAPVINEAGAPLGVLSQTDLVVHARERTGLEGDRDGPLEDFSEFPEVPVLPAGKGNDPALARDVMTPVVFSVRLDAPAAQVVEDMLALRVHRLFVVDGDGVLVGVVSATDLLRHLEPATIDES
jgi:CBS domain-containing protein